MGAFLLAESLKMRFVRCLPVRHRLRVRPFHDRLASLAPGERLSFHPLDALRHGASGAPSGILSAAGLALVVALQFFGGHPESSFQALFAAVCFFLLRVFQSPGGVAAAIRSAGPRKQIRGFGSLECPKPASRRIRPRSRLWEPPSRRLRSCRSSSF